MSKPISCIPTGVLLGSQRFPDRFEAPTVKSWRCELTALSQLHNLYFVACNDTIYVYQPSFPDQSISSEPELILHPPFTSDGIYGIDAEDPHSITRILVDYLGHEEILLATCDDGDVVGYRIREIVRALDHQRISVVSDEAAANDSSIKLFLHCNVGASAWGIAIHREARIVAISANTHNVVVFAYALADPEDDSQSSDFSEAASPMADEHIPDFPFPRKRDHVLTLRAYTNVPAISFNNNGDDPTGRWLFSSSIDGKTILWDLHKPRTPARMFQMGFCASVRQPNLAPQVRYGQCLCLRPDNVPHGAWGATFLDLRSALEVPSMSNHTGEKTPFFKDLSSQKSRFKLKPYINHPATWDLDDDTSDDGSEMDLSENEDDDSSNQQSSSEHDIAGDGDEMSAGSEDEIGQDMEDHIAAEAELASNNAAPGSAEGASTTFPNSPFAANPVPASNTSWEAMISMPNALPWEQSLLPSLRPEPYLEFTTAPTFQDELNPQAPCLVITKEEIFLLQKPLTTSGDYSEPVLTMRQPLHPESSTPCLASADRHCFSTQIPELGIFIIGSPVGRVGIFSITKSRQDSERNGHYTYGFNLEYILPFQKDETDRICYLAEPGARLIGVAVGPVQGMFDQPRQNDAGMGNLEDRRWRLMMYHTDHTVLSFEISKRRRGRTPGVDELIV